MWLQRAAVFLWAALMLLLPWPYGGVLEPVRYASAAALCLAGPGARGRDLLFAAPLALLCGWQVLARASAAPGPAIDATLLILAHALAAAGLRATLSAPDVARRASQVVVMSAVLQAGFAVLQFVHTPATVYGARTAWTTMPFGSFVNHNHFGAFAAAASMVALGLAWQASRGRRALPVASILWAGAAAALAISVLASHSRGAMLALGAGAVCFLTVGARSPRQRWLVAGASVLAATALLALLPQARARLLTVASGVGESSVGYRAAIAVATRDAIGERPLTGHGLGSFPDVVTRFKTVHANVRSQHAESDALQWPMETGLVGVLALLAAGFLLAPSVRTNLGDPQRRALAVGALSAMAVMLAHEGVDFSLRTPAVAAMFVGCLGVASACGEKTHRLRLAAWGFALMVACALGWRAAAAVRLDAAVGQRTAQARLAALQAAVLERGWMAEPWQERARAHVVLARGPAEGRHLARAEAAYDEALRWRPHSAEIVYELAWVQWRRGRRAEAEMSLARSRTLDPASWSLAIARAGLAYQLRGQRAAFEELYALRRVSPDVSQDLLREAGRPYGRAPESLK